MYIVLWLIIVILSATFSFISSGIEHLIQVNSTSWKYISIGYYFFIYCILIYAFYRFKFKSPSVLKFFFFRNMLRLNLMFKKLDSKVYSDKIELTPLQEKSIKIWYSLVKDKSSILNSSLSSHNRSIQRGGLLAILKTKFDTTLTIMDNEGKNLFYEVYVPRLYKDEMSDFFDKEVDKRMATIEAVKRADIESFIDIK